MNDNIKKVKQNMAKKGARFRDLFESSLGEQVLSDLEGEFLIKDLIGENEHETVVRAAQADVIMYIRRMMNFKLEGEEDEIELP